MSLINEALKRANQTELPNLPAMEIMQPVQTPAPSKLPLVVLPIVFVAVLGLGGWFLLRGWQVTRQAYLNRANTVVAARASAVAPLTNQISLVPPPAQVTPEAPGPTAVAKQEQPAAAPAIDPVPSFPKLRLQAVFYRPRNPSIVINSRMLHVGDQIDHATIVSIGRDLVVVEWEGEKRELSLP